MAGPFGYGSGRGGNPEARKQNDLLTGLADSMAQQRQKMAEAEKEQKQAQTDSNENWLAPGLQGAGMGAMFGPWGAAVGGGLGTLMGVVRAAGAEAHDGDNNGFWGGVKDVLAAPFTGKGQLERTMGAAIPLAGAAAQGYAQSGSAPDWMKWGDGKAMSNPAQDFQAETAAADADTRALMEDESRWNFMQGTKAQDAATRASLPASNASRSTNAANMPEAPDWLTKKYPGGRT